MSSLLVITQWATTIFELEVGTNEFILSIVILKLIHKDYRGSKLFYLKINNGFYMKAKCISNKLLFTELKKIINF